MSLYLDLCNMTYIVVIMMLDRGTLYYQTLMSSHLCSSPVTSNAVQILIRYQLHWLRANAAERQELVLGTLNTAQNNASTNIIGKAML